MAAEENLPRLTHVCFLCASVVDPLVMNMNLTILCFPAISLQKSKSVCALFRLPRPPSVVSAVCPDMASPLPSNHGFILQHSSVQSCPAA